MPVSGDMLVKLAFGAVLLGGLYIAFKVASGAASSVLTLPGRVLDSVVENVSAGAAAVADVPRRIVLGDGQTAAEGGQVWLDRFKAPIAPGTYESPMVSPSGMDYGQISG